MVPGLLLAAANAASTTADPGFTKANVLTTYVTMESLLFAGLSAAIALSATGTLGRKTPIEPWIVATITAVLLMMIAAGAVLAWSDLFGGKNWPASCNRRFEAIGILLGIVAQPLIAAAIARNVTKPKKPLH